MFFNLYKKIAEYNNKREEELRQKLLLKNRLNKNKMRFSRCINFAKELIDETNKRMNDSEFDSNELTNHPLFNLIRAIGLNINNKYIGNLIYETPKELPNIVPYEMGFPDKYFYDIVKEVSFIDVKMKLNKDLLLPWPWHRERFLNTFAFIGEGRLGGKWKQDCNHSVSLWLPMGLGWVDYGNHSIMQGIIQGEGEVSPNTIYDIRPIYDYVICDGINYIDIESGKKICSVRSFEIAAIFEIGRLMTQNGICYNSIL
ncbi:DUF6710 family protein [Vallitalea guaymasensis]|uniref:DUF6710 family protein n=1 Tax=Vallitalea guaymasensis TaxID=1185412 RepID=UPI000DE5642E|nr:DUF6710 family protein [Vallitalea guaymasensis]